MDYACEMMDLCRGTQEVEAVLSEGGEENGHTSRDPLARLKMAIEYEEKKVSFAHFYVILFCSQIPHSLPYKTCIVLEVAIAKIVEDTLFYFHGF